MQMQILDCDYTLLNNKPLVRLYGKTIDGESVCAFYNNFLPYFYLHADEDKFDDIIFELEKNDLNYEIVERFLPIGYGNPIKVLKIIGKDPSKIPEIRNFVKRFGTPYEADILFRYRFMVDFGLKGMGWVDVDGKRAITKTVKCKAIEAKTIKPLEILDNAPLKYMALDIECISEEDRIPIPEKDSIVIISLSFYPEYKNKKHLVLLAKPTKIDHDVIGCSDEKEMLKKLLEIMNDYDPDILIGYNINNYDLPHLIKRLEILQLPRDLGRSEKNAFCHKLQAGYLPNISGRVVVDPYDILRRDPWVKFKRYDLGTVAKELLKIEKLEMNGVREMRKLWNGNSENIKRFVDYARRDAELAMKLITDKGLLDKFFELAKISGLVLQDTLGGQTQRHECKLLHVFRDKKIMMPCKPEGLELRKRKYERERLGLKGALVLDPMIGLYTKGCILVLDFTSLYPSIIHNFNICPTTLLTKDFSVDHIVSPSGAKFVKPSVREGILSVIVKELISTRAAVRKQIKIETDPEIKRIMNAKQLALKDLSNSLYGYTAYIRARLYVMDVANSITSIGRENIVNSKKLIEDNFPVKVLYSDTDSVFIKTDIGDLEQAEEFGKKISSFVTNKLPGLELKFEKLYKTFLILTKKRYAGWTFERENGKWIDKIEMKGIETVRRDWCSLTSDTMLEVLNILLKEQDVKKAARHVRNVVYNLSKGLIPLEKLTIVKGITKSLDDYDGVQPHVELAKKITQRDKTRGSMVGERLEFVIIRGNQLLSKRAEDPEYVREKSLEIDSQYYVENQLLPPLERIFDACGVSASELLEGSKQKSLTDLFSKRQPSPEETILNGFDMVVCRNCDWSFRRPTLQGVCPKCSGPLYFSGDGSIGKTIDLS